MSIEWFRSYHGAPTDPKWRMIGKRAGVRPGDVAAIFWALMDFASQNDPRGSIDGFDSEELAIAFDFEQVDIDKVIQVLKDKGLIIVTSHNVTLAAWDKRQPKREDGTAAERQKKRRLNKNASETKNGENEKDENEENCGLDQSVTQSHAASRSVTQNHARAEQKQSRVDSKKDSPLTPHPVENLFEGKDLNIFFDACDACCLLLGGKKLSLTDQETLSSWCSKYDMVGYVFPFLIERIEKFRKKNGGKAPSSLAYFDKALKENEPANSLVNDLAGKMRKTL